MTAHLAQNWVQVLQNKSSELFLKLLSHEIVVLVLEDHLEHQLVAFLVFRFGEGVFGRDFLVAVDLHDHILELADVGYEVLPHVISHFIVSGVSLFKLTL